MTSFNLDKLFETIKGLRSSKDSESPLDEMESGRSYLLVGLGNPGREYRDTRHNIGFMLVDEIANRLEIEFSRTQLRALVTSGVHLGNRIILAKPQTFMNKSGFPAKGLMRFYKQGIKDTLIIYDDIDLPFGTNRLKRSGGSAGHKGMTSIIEQLGTSDFPRMRLGVGRPSGQKQAANYVLKPFNVEETEFLNVYLVTAADAVFDFIENGIESAMTKYNRSIS